MTTKQELLVKEKFGLVCQMFNPIWYVKSTLESVGFRIGERQHHFEMSLCHAPELMRFICTNASESI